MSTGIGPAKKFSVIVKLIESVPLPPISPWKSPFSESHLATAKSSRLTMAEIEVKRSIWLTFPFRENAAVVFSDMDLAVATFFCHCCSTVFLG